MLAFVVRIADLRLDTVTFYVRNTQAEADKIAGAIKGDNMLCVTVHDISSNCLECQVRIDSERFVCDDCYHKAYLALQAKRNAELASLEHRIQQAELVEDWQLRNRLVHEYREIQGTLAYQQ